MIRNVVTRGYGSGASIAFVVTRGYSIGETVQEAPNNAGAEQFTFRSTKQLDDDETIRAVIRAFLNTRH